jgi:hypothetical protein
VEERVDKEREKARERREEKAKRRRRKACLQASLPLSAVTSSCLTPQHASTEPPCRFEGECVEGEEENIDGAAEGRVHV